MMASQHQSMAKTRDDDQDMDGHFKTQMDMAGPGRVTAGPQRYDLDGTQQDLAEQDGNTAVACGRH